jgi:RNA polymerase sigma-70 factor, ECF subfamily
VLRLPLARSVDLPGRRGAEIVIAVEHDRVLRAAAAGDDEALAVLVRAYHDRVYRFGKRVCRDAFDAEDAVQEAFAKLVRRPDVIQDRGALAWLFTVVRNTCTRLLRPFMRARKHLGERLDDTMEIASSELSPEAALERWHLVQAVHAAIATLEPDLREVIVLRDIEGQSGEEACHALGLSVAAMKSRLHRARAAVRAHVSHSARGTATRAGAP